MWETYNRWNIWQDLRSDNKNRYHGSGCTNHYFVKNHNSKKKSKAKAKNRAGKKSRKKNRRNK